MTFCTAQETATKRYELIQQDAEDKKELQYTLSRVICPQLLDQDALLKQARPLKSGLVEVVFADLSWRDIKWSPAVSLRARPT